MANYRFKAAEIEAMKQNILTHIEHETENKTAWRLRCAIEGQLLCCRPSKREAARLERELTLYEKLTKNDLPNWQSKPTQAATPTETPQISTETAETVNVSAEGENAAERTSIEQNHSDTRIVEDEYRHKYKVTRHWLNGRVESIEVWDLDLAAEPPQSPETPQAVECTTDSDCRVCSHCGKHFHEGYFLGDEYACSEECAVALYGGDRELFEADLEAEEEEAGATECYWTTW